MLTHPGPVVLYIRTIKVVFRIIINASLKDGSPDTCHRRSDEDIYILLPKGINHIHSIQCDENRNDN
jgi:hypothetical protein